MLILWAGTAAGAGAGAGGGAMFSLLFCFSSCCCALEPLYLLYLWYDVCYGSGGSLWGSERPEKSCALTLFRF